jgi:glucokinase
MMRVLAADIGGTKTAFALYSGDDANSLELERKAEYASAGAVGLEPLVARFLGSTRVDAAGFGVAGPVSNGVCHTTNLPWIIRLESLREVCGTAQCSLRNDAEAAILGIRAASRVRTLVWNSATVDPQAPVALATVGTGFGRAYLVPPAHAFATEGGHASFAARTERDVRLLQMLRARHAQVAVEHVVSGPGLYTLFEAVLEQRIAAPERETLERLREADDKSAVVSELGVGALDAACVAAVRWFAELLGAELGNIALQTIPRGGLYVWGGVARKLKSTLSDGTLREAFLDKNRMRPLLESIPLALLDEPDLALLGAREAALRT